MAAMAAASLGINRSSLGRSFMAHHLRISAPLAKTFLLPTRLSGPELSALAERLVQSEDPVEASRVRESIINGFYGARKNAQDSPAQFAAGVASSSHRSSALPRHLAVTTSRVGPVA